MAGYQQLAEVHFTLEGLTDLLMSNPGGMARSAAGPGAGGLKNIPTAEEEAEARAYRDGDTNLVMPATAVYRALIDAGAMYTLAGRKTLKAIMAASLYMVEPFFALTDAGGGQLHDYRIDQRRAVNKGSGGSVVRARPLIPAPWYLQCHFLIDANMLNNQLDMVARVVDTAGARMGIGDYRPQKMGPFGRFHLHRFSVNGEAMNLTALEAAS